VFTGPTEVIAHETDIQITFAGVLIAQFWRDLLLWEIFLNKYAVQSVVELGTYRGGMSLYLLMQCIQRNMSFFTFDREDAVALRSTLGRKLGLHDCFYRGDYFADDAAKRKVLDTITDPANHPLALFCDGDYKSVEYHIFGPLLARDDFVIVHDYGKTAGVDTSFVPEDAEESLTEEIMVTLCDRFESRTRFFRRI